jgi:hypothetical protein
LFDGCDNNLLEQGGFLDACIQKHRQNTADIDFLTGLSCFDSVISQGNPSRTERTEVNRNKKRKKGVGVEILDFLFV